MRHIHFGIEFILMKNCFFAHSAMNRIDKW